MEKIELIGKPKIAESRRKRFIEKIKYPLRKIPYHFYHKYKDEIWRRYHISMEKGKETGAPILWDSEKKDIILGDMEIGTRTTLKIDFPDNAIAFNHFSS